MSSEKEELKQESSIKESVNAALLVLAEQFVRERGMSALPNTVKAICEQLGVSRSQAYVMRDRLAAVCEDLCDPPEPKAEEVSPDVLFPALAAVRDFLYDNPGCVYERGARRFYSDSYRQFVVGLRAPGQVGEGLTIDQLACVAGAPPSTIEQWLRAGADKE